MKRRNVFEERRRIARQTTHEADFHHNVYVVLLRPAVARKVLRENPVRETALARIITLRSHHWESFTSPCATARTQADFGGDVSGGSAALHHLPIFLIPPES